MKNLLYSQIDGGRDLLDINDESKKQYSSQASKWDRRDLLRSLQILTDLSSKIRQSDDPYLLVEFSSLKLLEMDKSVNIESFLSSNNIHENFTNLQEKEPSSVQIKPFKELSKEQTKHHTPDTTKNQADLKINPTDHRLEDNLNDTKTDLNTPKKEAEESNNSMDKLDSNVKIIDSKNIAGKQTDEKFEKLDLTSVDKKWQDFIDAMHIKRPSIASILDKSQPIRISSSDIIFEIASTLDFHINQIEKNRDSLVAVLSKIFGNGVNFKVQKGYEKEVKSFKNSIRENTTETENHEQVRDKVVDLFDGEIIT